MLAVAPNPAAIHASAGAGYRSRISAVEARSTRLSVRAATVSGVSADSGLVAGSAARAAWASRPGVK